MPSHGPFAPGIIGANEWRPDMLPNLVAAFDMRKASSVTVDGTDTITNWASWLGLAYFFSPSGTTPKKIANGWTSSSGLTYDCARGNGTTDELICSNTVGGLTLPDRMLGGTDQPGTIILVAQMTSTTGSRMLVAFSHTAVGSGGRQLVIDARYGSTDWNAYKQDDAGGSATLSYSGGGLPDTAKHVHALACAPTTADYWIDGVSVASGAFDAGAFTSNRVELFSRAGANYLAGDIVIADFYSDTKSSTDLANICAGYARTLL